jgi:heme/copper-type cytochrome/quinol oxidase subunit 4
MITEFPGMKPKHYRLIANAMVVLPSVAVLGFFFYELDWYGSLLMIAIMAVIAAWISLAYWFHDKGKENELN